MKIEDMLVAFGEMRTFRSLIVCGVCARMDNITNGVIIRAKLHTLGEICKLGEILTPQFF